MKKSHLRLEGRWFRIELTLARDDEDLAITLAHADGAIGATTRPAGPHRTGLNLWFDERSAAEAAAARLAAIRSARLTGPAAVEERDPGWLDASLPPRAPIDAGRFSIVDADAEGRDAEDASSRVRILLPRGRAFGTGEHDTTRFCLELLGEHVSASAKRVLDLGTGSGILAIAAARAGAGAVLALDNDPQVLEVARENARRNGVDALVDVRRGSWSSLGPEDEFEVIVANIHRTTLVSAALALATRLVEDGVAILSGFPPTDVERVSRAWGDAGCHRAGLRESHEWAALVMRKAAAPSDSGAR